MKVCLAGIENLSLLQEEAAKIPFLLESFYYWKDWMAPIVKNARFFLLDSGAFTFMSGAQKKEVNWRQYVDAYAAHIRRYDIQHFFELDIDSIVGYERVLELREELERKAGRKCIPVWHKSRGLEDFRRTVHDYRYAAIGGLAIKDIKPKDYEKLPAFIHMAHKEGCQLHGLGFTGFKWLDKCRFDSVDSTSWKSGRRFGQIYHFKDGNMRMVRYKDKRIGDYKAADIHNLRQWIRYQYWADIHL